MRKLRPKESQYLAYCCRARNGIQVCPSSEAKTLLTTLNHHRENAIGRLEDSTEDKTGIQKKTKLEEKG